MVLAHSQLCLSADHSGLAQKLYAEHEQMNPFVDALLGEMTIEEKLGQLNQVPSHWSNTGPTIRAGDDEEMREGMIGSFLSFYGAESCHLMQRMAVEETRLGIPVLFAHDVIHGFRTIFPVPLAESCSWDLGLLEQTARIAAVEATAHGVHWTFAPMVDIARDSRWGRVVEGAGEDPYLASLIAAARVRGFQGENLGASDTLLACAKHLAAYGGVEAGRDYNTVDISDRTLRELYLPPFKACVDAGVETFIAAFNEIAGVPCHANAYLTNQILREEWGFEGLVVSDYTGVMELTKHGVAESPTQAGILALSSGVDIDMVSRFYAEYLPDAVKSGDLDLAIVDEAVRRVLRAKYKLGLFEDPYRYGSSEQEKELTLTPEHRKVARAMAQKSMVLLKNENQTLPLSKTVGQIAVIGEMATSPWVGLGNWAAAGQIEDVVTILQGIEAAVSSGTIVKHAKGVDVRGDDVSGIPEAVELAEQSDVVILVAGEMPDMSAEAHNRTFIGLPGKQLELAKALHATGKPMVVVLANGRPLAIPWLDEQMDAILESWFGGIEMGHALADLLFGDVSPSGKLTITFPYTTGQVPIYYNHKNTGRPADSNDPYTSKYLDAPWTPLYAFGHGLSYTRFEYSDLKLSRQNLIPDKTLTVRCKLSNVGEMAATEVAQLYIRDRVASVTRPVKELKGFQRVLLKPGESQELIFELKPEDLSFLNLKMERVVEPGVFDVWVGGSSLTEFGTQFEVMREKL